MSARRIVFGTLIILIGLSMLLDINVLRYFIPLLIIYFGFKIIVGEDKSVIVSGSETHEDKINRVVIFSGLNNKYISDNFKGGSVVTVFGGGDIDLTDAKTKEKNIKLDLVAVFGGLKVRVPKKWQVNSEGAGILGAFDNNAVKEGDAGVLLNVEGVSIFGGVEVTN